LYIVGNTTELGNWDPKKSIQMTWRQDNHWICEITHMVEDRQELEYKFLVEQGGAMIWDNGQNHKIQVKN